MALLVHLRRLLLPLLAVVPIPARGAVPTLVLVETAPVETTLAHDDLPDAARVWPEMIGGARATLDIAQFYVAAEPGEPLDPVIAAIEAAALRGVRVRILADSKFHGIYPETLDRLALHPGIQVRLLDLGARDGVLHAKYFVVDDREIYVGSQNFDWRSLSHVQELGVRTDAPGAVRAFARTFAADWAIAGGDRAPAASPEPAPADEVLHDGAPVRVRAVFSPADLPPGPGSWDLPALVALIDGARRTVRVQLLSYEVHGDGAPFDDLDAALRRAAARGVEVRLLVSDWSLGPDGERDLKDLQGVEGVEVRFASIPEASRGFIPFARVVHAKYLVVDGERAWIGTSNWSRGYFHASRNAGLILEGAATGARLDRFHEDLWSSSYARVLDPDVDHERPRTRSEAAPR